jgi:hypothetical protein
VLLKTSDPDEFLLPVGWTLFVMYDEAADKTDYWYRAPSGQQWTDRQCGTAAFESGRFFTLPNLLITVGVLYGAYWLLWKKK